MLPAARSVPTGGKPHECPGSICNVYSQGGMVHGKGCLLNLLAPAALVPGALTAPSWAKCWRSRFASGGVQQALWSCMQRWASGPCRAHPWHSLVYTGATAGGEGMGGFRHASCLGHGCQFRTLSRHQHCFNYQLHCHLCLPPFLQRSTLKLLHGRPISSSSSQPGFLPCPCCNA